jgi:glycine/D-amino acid oxidase-like deaminating enzyme
VSPLEGTREENGAVEINHSGWVNCALFINSFRSWLQQQELFIKEEFNYSALVYGDAYLRYADYKFEHIIFCEGYDAIKNPFFTGEQLIPCKGDVLSVFCQQLKTDQIVKKKANAISFPRGIICIKWVRRTAGMMHRLYQLKQQKKKLKTSFVNL